MPHGLVAAALAYILWGVFPLYIKQVAQRAGAAEVVAHRSAWSLVFVFGLLLLVLRRAALAEGGAGGRRARWRVFAAQRPAAEPRTGWSTSGRSGHDRILDASLGYFINPLFNVLLGVVFLHERPRPRAVGGGGASPRPACCG